MRKRWVALGLAAFCAAAGGIAWMASSGHRPEELAELVSEGGEKVLRDTLRPARGAPRVLLFALDGVGADELDAVARGGRAPRLAALLGRPVAGEPGVWTHAYAAPGVLSILPSTTFAAWTSTFTGEPPAVSGVPGNEWFDRVDDRFHAPAPVTVAGFGDALRVYTDQLMGTVTRAPTLYERAGVRSFVSLAALHRGADLVTVPSPAALGDVLADMGEGMAEGEVERELYEELDQGAVKSLLATIEKRGVADLQVVYFPGVDLWTHVAPHPLADERAYLEKIVDHAIGQVLDAYGRRGALEGTYVVIVADHGHTPVLSDDRHSLGTEGDDEPPAVLERAGFRVRPFTLDVPREERRHQAVVAYQGAFAYVYLADRSTCPGRNDRCDWKRPPRLEEDVLPVARAFFDASRTGAGVPELRGTIDLVLAREPRPPGTVAAPFQVWDGRRLVPIAEYLAANPRPELLRLEERLRGLAVGPQGHLAGDVLLLARTGIHLPPEERFYFSGIYHSWHGSPTDQDSRIPLVVARPGGDGGRLRETVRRAVGDRPTQLDVTRLVLALLGRPPAAK